MSPIYCGVLYLYLLSAVPHCLVTMRSAINTIPLTLPACLTITGTPHHTTPHLHHCHNTRASLTFLLCPHMSGVFLFQRSELFTGLSAARLGPLYCLCWACDVTARRHSSSSSSPSLLVQSAQPSPGTACSTGSNQAGKSPD